MSGQSVAALLLSATLASTSASQEYLPDLPVSHPAIRYAEREVDDPIARLAREIERGTVELERDDTEVGYLPALLKHLDVLVDSQALVFSKTSFQAPLIAPDNPRAIYFNDDVAVTFVRGSDMIEMVSMDAEIGPVFYTADIHRPGSAESAPRFERRQICLKCHLGPATSGVPGLFVGSVIPGPTGKPQRIDAIITDHRTALDERWGGWYVNATRGQQKDRSNAVASNPAQPFVLDADAGRNLPHLYGKFDPDGYLSSVSDIVALMTFEHQTQMLNYFTRVKWEERIALGDGKDPLEAPQLRADIDALIDYMLFVDEVPLTEPLEGVSSFRSTFPERGPRDTKDRSLRDFDLETRLFRYPLSYMIYTRSFDGLSDSLKAQIYRSLHRVLTNDSVDNEKYAHLTLEDRRTVLEILRETKTDLPNYFEADGASSSSR